MLKIKDGVDLKELEKFGFQYRENAYIKWIKSFRVSDLRVEADGKHLYYSLNADGNNDIKYASTLMIGRYITKLELDGEDLRNLIQDLIQARIIEEVEEQYE